MSGSYTDPDAHVMTEHYFIQDSLAIHRLKATQNDNNSGYCKDEDCGERIPKARLKAVPNAKYCIHCQAKRDANPLTFVCRNHYVP